MLIAMLFSCENDVAEVKSLDSDTLYPANSAKNVEVTYSEKGRISLQLNAPVLNQYSGEKEYDEMPEGVHVKIFDKQLNVTTELTSNYAIKYTYLNTMEAKYDVVVRNEKGETLNTEHLFWDETTGDITSDVFVKITTADQIIMGEGLISNQDFSDYRILKPSGIINIANDSID
jgi:LPS export ABC transporter protein LptC